MVTPAGRERMKKEKEAEKQRLRESREAARLEKEAKKQQEASEREKKRKEREAQEAEREMKRKEKEAKKQQEEDKKKQTEAEKEQRRKEKEALEAEKEVKRKERELKKQQEEADKEAKRKERELKRQQEEAEKETKRKEKEAAERKKQLLLEKQANIMSRLFRKKETDSPPENPQENRLESMSPEPEDVVSRVDEELKSTCTTSEAELLRNHMVSWQETWKSRSREPFRRYGLRTAPKIAVSTELRLQGSARKVDLKRKRHMDEAPDDSKLEDNIVVLDDDPDAICTPPRKKQLRWKLLQFDKSHRPAFYGTMSKSSPTIGPRHPLKKDASLDYEVDSDEEWEEEDPGESLSDCEDKEEEAEKADAEEDEDAADGFVVPDGYLSEEEGVHMDEEPVTEIGQCSKTSEELAKAPEQQRSKRPNNPMAALSDRKTQHHMKLLDNVINHALQRNRPFLVNNLDPSREGVENQTERLCLQALRMVVMTPDVVITPHVSS